MDQKGDIDFFHIFVGWKILGSKLDGIFTYFCWDERPSVFKIPGYLGVKTSQFPWQPRIFGFYGAGSASDPKGSGMAIPPVKPSQASNRGTIFVRFLAIFRRHILLGLA